MPETPYDRWTAAEEAGELPALPGGTFWHDYSGSNAPEVVVSDDLSVSIDADGDLEVEVENEYDSGYRYITIPAAVLAALDEARRLMWPDSAEPAVVAQDQPRLIDPGPSRQEIRPHLEAERQRAMNDATLDAIYPEPVPDYADMLTTEEWRAGVESGCLTDDDGFGEASNGTHVTGTPLSPSDVLPAGATHVAWFNK